MDTVILVLSAAALFTIGYGFVWTGRAIRRVGLRRFARALGALVWAVLVAGSKLFRPGREDRRRKQSGPDRVPINAVEDGAIHSRENQERSAGLNFNCRTGRFDDGMEPFGIYVEGFNSDDGQRN